MFHRKLVLRIIDALESLCHYQSKDSFIQGFKLGAALTTELINYNAQLDELNAQKAGHLFITERGIINEILERAKNNWHTYTTNRLLRLV